MDDELQAFEDFLVKKKKSNGDKLLDSTIERYLEWIGKYHKKVSVMKPDADMIEYINNEVFYVKSGVLHAAFKNYLQFRRADKKLIRELEKTEKNANAMTSVRFLQSKVLSRGELRRIMNEECPLQTKTIVSALYDTACRRSELLSIKWGDIQFRDPKKHSADIKAGLYASVSIIGKGKKSREVYLGSTTVTLLRKMNEEKKFEKQDPIFVIYGEDTTTPLKRQDHALYELVHKQLDKILKRHVHPHCFRHTKATHLADNGADVLDIASYLGHSNIAATQIYIEISSFRGMKAYKEFSKDIMLE